MSEQQGPLDLASLRGTICVVTGAGNGGIGWGIAARAAELGMHIAVLDLHEKACSESAASLQSIYQQVRCIGVGCDVTQPESCEAAAASVLDAFPGFRIGAVFANAGVIFFDGPILKSSMSNWKMSFDVNVLGVVNTIRAFVPLLQRSTEPSVMCTTASIGGFMRAVAGAAAYASTKHAVVALTEALSFELALKFPQIRVCVCAPCQVATGLGATSMLNKEDLTGSTARGQLSQEDFGLPPEVLELFMTPKKHGDQVWDRIAAGEFYMICDNIAPYVDHEFPFGGDDAIERRFAAMRKPSLQRSIDNSVALARGQLAFHSPLTEEQSRRARARLGKTQTGSTFGFQAKAKM